VDQQGYVKETRYLYIAGMNNIRRHFERNRQTVYSRDIAWEYVLERRKQYENGDIAYDTFLYTWKTAEMLDEYFQTGYVTRHKSKAWGNKRLCPMNETLLAKYEHKKIERGYSTSTLTGERSVINSYSTWKIRGLPMYQKLSAAIFLNTSPYCPSEIRRAFQTS